MNTTPERRIVIHREKRYTTYFSEPLSDEVGLDMVQIPGGTFLMGSPHEELKNHPNEQPRHSVSVPSFFMGRYPITQAQWRVVAAYPEVERELKPDPSRFKGENRPVERVSWEDAVEFCQRLSVNTSRSYRLPSEAEWEYACRAGTQTPFHFGETLTDELANYDATKVYGRGVIGEHRGETTEVGQFSPNNFGLHDMHGNVWEWCQDDWHGNYEGAPEDGSAWLDENSTENKKVLRGGSWFHYPRNCRCAIRYYFTRVNFYNLGGFRVVCVPVVAGRARRAMDSS
ncbi:formylglycine-generating enzyme family protein [Geitlerinema sp. P-1104]|uniref:formylglycine-generating enzyme family protein n=1 Tax=Geitlerinema sp. P-1104 TaxID=2546230 RepID=UPI001476F46B|nr:formylglycine-generating enzyme family protein [Geitlerinema sp. P-1104]NMG59708.1 formylglycine-generating enzyme family protein [Geitlerinema sp. P-1104]